MGILIVDTAESAEQAFSHLALGSVVAANAPTQFDLSCLDFVMPNTDGIQSCACLAQLIASLCDDDPSSGGAG